MFLTKITSFINGNMSSTQIMFSRKRIFCRTPNEMFYPIGGPNLPDIFPKILLLNTWGRAWLRAKICRSQESISTTNTEGTIRSQGAKLGGLRHYHHLLESDLPSLPPTDRNSPQAYPDPISEYSDRTNHLPKTHRTLFLEKQFCCRSGLGAIYASTHQTHVRCPQAR